MFICKSCRAVLRRAPSAFRRLHLWQSSGSSVALPDGITRVATGVGFSVAYAPLASSRLWLLSDDSPLVPARHNQQQPEGSTSLHCLQLPRGAVKQVSCGRAHMAILSSSGEVYSAGLNCYGQCGVQPTAEESRPIDELPQLNRIPHLPGKITEVSCGLDHTLFLTAQGRVLACGWSADGQTGTGGYQSVLEVTKIESVLTHSRVSSVFTCGDSSFALTASGLLYAWGNNEYGQLAITSPEPQVCEPMSVDCSSLDGEVVSMAAGGSFTAFLTSAGSVYYAGYGIREDHGLDPRQLSQMRILHNGKEEAGKVTAILAGLHYLVMQTTAIGHQELLLWGRYPAADDPRIGDTDSPLELQLPSPVRYLSCGPTQLLALLE